MFDSMWLYKLLSNGLWPRVLASMFLSAALWWGIYRRRFVVGVIFFILTFMLTYCTNFVTGMVTWLAAGGEV